jgi:hypothetical protein
MWIEELALEHCRDGNCVDMRSAVAMVSSLPASDNYNFGSAKTHLSSFWTEELPGFDSLVGVNFSLKLDVLASSIIEACH